MNKKLILFSVMLIFVLFALQGCSQGSVGKGMIENEGDNGESGVSAVGLRVLPGGWCCSDSACGYSVDRPSRCVGDGVECPPQKGVCTASQTN